MTDRTAYRLEAMHKCEVACKSSRSARCKTILTMLHSQSILWLSMTLRVWPRWSSSESNDQTHSGPEGVRCLARVINHDCTMGTAAISLEDKNFRL